MENYLYFQTFEERELSFRKEVHSLIPRKFSGPSIFYKDWFRALGKCVTTNKCNIAYITSNPIDCLAYSFVNDLLIATNLLLHSKSSMDLIEKAVDLFDISQIRNQQIHTLSGGEIVKLALAKSYLLSTISDKAIITYPFTWLSVVHKNKYDLFINSFINFGKKVDILTMAGEDDSIPPSVSINSSINSDLYIDQLRIKLSCSICEDYGLVSWVLVDNVSFRFASPCLLTGDNGSGKSLIAKALSNAIQFSGTAKIQTHGFVGQSRLLFQDVITQAMLRPFSVLMSSSRGAQTQDVAKIYDEIITEFKNYFNQKNERIPSIGNKDSSIKTLLEYKMMLIAIRICGKPSAIILDEPDWGLCKEVAVALVVSVINVSHKNEIAVILISHKNWWKCMTKSHMIVTKSLGECNNIKYNLKITMIDD